MAVIKYYIYLGIPEVVYNAIPLAKKTAFRDAVRAMKALAVKINAGRPEKEMTVRATWHKCYHDEGKPCEAGQEI